MQKTNVARERLSIDVLPDEHRQIKIYAAIYGKTIREYVIESVQDRLRNEVKEVENRALSGVITHLDHDPILKELWDNKKDADYDKT